LPSRTPSATISATGFADTVAVASNGRPSGAQVVALLHRSSVLPTGVAVTVTTGPLCAGSWQYTVVSATGREPLYVLSRGAPQSLSLVTAGTNVCTVEVRTNAPPGIRAAARCDSA
jgi:hypothetical protein